MERAEKLGKLEEGLQGLKDKIAADRQRAADLATLADGMATCNHEKWELEAKVKAYTKVLIQYANLDDQPASKALAAEAKSILRDAAATIATADEILGFINRGGTNGAAEVVRRLNEVKGASAKFSRRTEALISQVASLCG